jgi:hypothetical protein
MKQNAERTNVFRVLAALGNEPCCFNEVSGVYWAWKRLVSTVLEGKRLMSRLGRSWTPKPQLTGRIIAVDYFARISQSLES